MQVVRPEFQTHVSIISGSCRYTLTGRWERLHWIHRAMTDGNWDRKTELPRADLYFRIAGSVADLHGKYSPGGEESNLEQQWKASSILLQWGRWLIIAILIRKNHNFKVCILLLVCNYYVHIFHRQRNLYFILLIYAKIVIDWHHTM
jgi:hypothetical protein